MPSQHSTHKPVERYRVIRLGGGDASQASDMTGATARGAVIRVRVRDNIEGEDTAPPSGKRMTD